MTRSPSISAEPQIPGYPFSAIVGHDQLRLSLILCAIHPGIGGVLVRGEKGTAKSTIVRALARLLPPVPGMGADHRSAHLVELPVGATEDRVVGSIDLEKVLRDGERAFQPGLLARAHLGVLYVDEVNLLHDHLVDVLLDAAAMGRVHVERDGFSHTYPSVFVLVGTMNPEEGELRPQLLDRFGLTVDVIASRDVSVRAEVVRRRLAYELDPDGFVDNYSLGDAELAERIAAARDRRGSVALPDVEVRRIASLCAQFDVDGMRADLVIARTAIAHAAWRGADAVAEEDVRVAAELALPHRRRRDPFDEPGLDSEQLDQALEQAKLDAGEPDSPLDPGAPQDSDTTPETGAASPVDSGSEDPDNPSPDNPSPDYPDPEDPGPDDSGPGGGVQAPEASPGAPSNTNSRSSRSAAPEAPFRARLLEVPGVGEGAPGRRSRSHSERGRAVRPTTYSGRGIHVPATVISAAEHTSVRGRVSIRPSDVRGVDREGKEGNLVVFVVDTSGSMAARDRLASVTGAAVSLLRDAYQRRDKVAVITMRGTEAELVLPPTNSIDIAARRLADIRTGGRTPLAEGLVCARKLVRRERVRDPQRRPLIVILTDGRATAGTDPVERAHFTAAALAREGTASITVDCERGMVELGLARDLARLLRGGYVRLADLSADAVSGVVRAAA